MYFTLQMKKRHRSGFLPVVTAFAALSTGCSVYFNTFYNAETAFNKGYAIHEKAMRNFPDSIVTEPPADARAKYDRAIEKAQKVLDVFPKDKKWHDDALFLLGKAYFYEKEFGKSRRRFRQLRDEYPQSPFVPESYVYYARAYIAEEDLARAEETLKFTLEKYPYLDKDQEISLLLAEVSIRREGKARAAELLEQMRAAARSSEKKEVLLLRTAELYMDMQQYERAAALLEKASRGGKQTARDYRIERNLVSCYAAMGSYDKALKLLSVMLADKRFFQYNREIIFVKGTILVHLGRIDEAIACFREIVESGASADTAARQSDTNRVINRAWLELGKLYQKRKGNFAEAQKYYKLVAERSVQDSAATPFALRRLQAMTKIDSLRARLAAGTRDTSMRRAGALFSVGELFYYDLDEPDSACAQFLAAASDSVRDTLITPRALFAAAAILRADKADTVRSDSLFRLIVSGFPESDAAAGVHDRSAAVPAVKNRRQRALEAFRNAESAFFSGNDAKTAVQGFYAVYREYPDLPIAPKSLFAAAWLTDNELQKKKTAKSLYQKICDRYPQSVYCMKEAQPRIKVVLDTIEALRRQSAGAAARPGIAVPAALDSLAGTDTAKAASARADSAKAATVVPPAPAGRNSSAPVDSLRRPSPLTDSAAGPDSRPPVPPASD